MRYHSLRAFVHGEPVLSTSLVCAVISMFFAPPSAAYLGYIDTRVLILLLCLMAVVSGMQKYGVFDLLAQKLLAGRHALRTRLRPNLSGLVHPYQRCGTGHSGRTGLGAWVSWLIKNPGSNDPGFFFSINIRFHRTGWPRWHPQWCDDRAIPRP